jgi:hypothetical protein
LEKYRAKKIGSRVVASGSVFREWEAAKEVAKIDNDESTVLPRQKTQLHKSISTDKTNTNKGEKNISQPCSIFYFVCVLGYFLSDKRLLAIRK